MKTLLAELRKQGQVNANMTEIGIEIETKIRTRTRKIKTSLERRQINQMWM